MKKLFLFFAFLIFGTGSAQLDTEHWFAPMASSIFGQSGLNISCYLYLSTNETTPFSVDIYSGNELYQTVEVEKGNPLVMNIPVAMMITGDVKDMFKPVLKGLHLKGDKRYFANFRFSMPNHAEIITSKGLAGLGKTFYAAMAKNTTSGKSITSTIGITATEDNTTVKISGYNPQLVFFDKTSTPTKTTILNSGESYIVNLVTDDSPVNLEGLIGAKIEASEPITVTNGNYNAIYTFENSSNNDILMDQSVPVERLGKEFVLVKGNGPSLNNMEAGLIVATEDNTEIIINGEPTGVVLNAGQYYLAKSTNYSIRGANHYSMSINTSKNVYLYQLLAGVEFGNPYATGGFNFIPALSCFLPNSIDEIAFINNIGSDNFTTKLNIITQTGGVVKVNGRILSGDEGPYTVKGNPDWETYNVLNISGNITVNSTKSVTAGIVAGDENVGYGGYFAGFSSVPVISKTGDCFSSVTLQVDDSYDEYEWFLNGVLIAGEIKNFIDPQKYGSGTYTCNIVKINCGSKLTAPYQFTICPPIVSTNYILGSCNTFQIRPAFSNSTQTIRPDKTRIRIQGTSGKAVVDKITGFISYTPNLNLNQDSSDTFVYYIEGNAKPEDTEFFIVTVDLKFLVVKDDSLTVCENADGTGTYDLTKATNSIDPNNATQYFSDVNLTQPIINFTSFISLPRVVYAKITAPSGCTKNAKIDLKITYNPRIDLTNFNPTFCDEFFTGNVSLKLSELSPKLITNFGLDYIFKYYLNPADQQNGNNNYLPDDFTYSSETPIYFRIENIRNCAPKFGQIVLKVGDRIPLLKSSVTEILCDNKIEGTVSLDLANYRNAFTTNSKVTFTTYLTKNDAEKKQNVISSTQEISENSTFYLRFENVADCPQIGELNLIFNQPKKSDILFDQTICPEARIDLDAGPGFDSYLWSTGEKTEKINVSVGEYYVDLGFNNCIYRQIVNVIAADLPMITNIEISGNSATVSVIGGTPPYQYSLDNIFFQNSNIFKNIPRGAQIIYVKDAKNCESVKKDFLILNFINVISPNGDGINDKLDYSDLKTKNNVNIEIYNRYGQSVFKAESGTFIWDGKSQGRNLPTGSYWYKLQWTEPESGLPVSAKGWVLLKNRN